MVKRLTLVCGPSGIGKSTLAEALVDKLGGIWREADTYFINDDGQYVFNAGDLPKAHQWCQDECRDWMIAGCENFVISNTFTTEWERKPYIDLAQFYYYELVIVKLTTDMPALVLAGKSVHHVPVDVVQKQKNRMS